MIVRIILRIKFELALRRRKRIRVSEQRRAKFWREQGRKAA